MRRVFTVLAMLTALCLSAARSEAQTGTEDRLGVCAKYTDAAKKSACEKRLAERRAEKKAKQDAARKELQERVDAACAGAPDKTKCTREETTKLRKGKVKAREKAKKGTQ